MKISLSFRYLADLRATLCLLVLMVSSCQNFPKPIQAYQPPGQRTITLAATTDTLHFALDPDIYNSVRSLNYYVDKGKEYMAFHDKVSGSVSIYEMANCRLVKKIKLRKLLPYRSISKKTTVYVKNTDSFFIINNNRLYLFDSSLILKDSISTLNKPFPSFAAFRTEAPPFFTDGKLYLRSTPYLSAKKKKEYVKWKSLYEFDFATDKARLLYPPPKRYQDSLYGYYFFDAAYCINDDNRLVLSYAADSNLYETDLLDYHVAHNAKSRFYQGDIEAVTDSLRLVKDGMKTAYLQRDSYGSVYFDPGTKRYLRVAEQKLTERDLLFGATGKPNKTVIVLDEHLKVIGEGKLPSDFSLKTLLFTQSGKMYVRVKAKDEYNIHLLRLAYQEDSVSTQLAKHP